MNRRHSQVNLLINLINLFCMTQVARQASLFSP